MRPLVTGGITMQWLSKLGCTIFFVFVVVFNLFKLVNVKPIGTDKINLWRVNNLDGQW